MLLHSNCTFGHHFVDRSLLLYARDSKAGSSEKFVVQWVFGCFSKFKFYSMCIQGFLAQLRSHFKFKSEP